ncbi:MAG: hypothetical protein J0M20_17155 [Burkholderiales bacterium]|nr:hypothetical protein [Burkholderiales bacterium]
MTQCIESILKLPDAAQDALLERIERLMRMGYDQKAARKAAAQALYDEALAETREMEQLIREQHPDLFLKKPERSPPPAAEPAPAVAPAKAAPSGEPVFSRREGQGFELPDFGAARQAQEAIQDRYNRWKQSINAVREQGGTITEANDFYAAEERYWGKVGAQNEDFGREVERFAEAVHADGLSVDDVALYAYAQHAQERNAYIAAKREDMQDGGSGMTDEEAEAILESARESGLETDLQKHADTLRQWIDGTRDVLERGGLITAETRASWDRSFRYYVPLRGQEGKAEGRGIGPGFSIKGPEAKRALGRRSQAKQIIEQIIQDRTRALIRSGKNEVLRSFLAFVLDNPSPNLWQVNAVQPRAVVRLDDEGHESIVMEDRVVTGRNVVTVKDGGQEVHILVKDPDLLRQLQGIEDQQVGRVVGAMLWANRTVGKMLTVYNPVFTLLNGARDLQAATVGMVQEFGANGATELAKQYPAALAEAVRAELRGKPSPDYQMFRALGGTTGFALMGDLQTTEDELRSLMRNAERGALHPVKVGRALAHYVEQCNAVVEAATRFAAYQAARSNGASMVKAASVSKNITVNFNRKGTKTPWLSALVLFWNPAIQGSARIAQNLASPAGLTLMGSAMAGAFFLALGNAEWGGEDDDGVSFWDKVPAEVKERNLVILSPFGPKKNEAGQLEANYIKLPLAYGYNVFKVLADQMADQMRRSKDGAAARPASESAMRVASAFLSAVQPINYAGQGLADSSALTMLPYSNALGPVAQALANRGSFGGRLHPESPQTEHLPDSSKVASGQAGNVFDRTAKALNKATGGSEFESGLIDIAPGSLENAARFYGGGIASFSLDLMNAFYARQHLERDKPELQRLPFMRQLLGQINDETDRLGFDRLRAADAMAQPYEAAAKKGDIDAAERLLQEHGPIAAAGRHVDRVRAQLAKLRQAERAVIEDDTMTDRQKLAELTLIRIQVRDVLNAWNETFDILMRDHAKTKETPQ